MLQCLHIILPAVAAMHNRKRMDKFYVWMFCVVFVVGKIRKEQLHLYV